MLPSSFSLGGGDMEKTPDSGAMKTIEDLIQSQMIEREAIIRLLIKKGVMTHEEFREEVAMLSSKIKGQQK
jgi:hypothetical protein